MIAQALKEARTGLSRFNSFERDDRVAEVHRLTQAGVSAGTIATLVGLSMRQVQRMRGEEPRETQPVTEPDLSEERAEQVERLVNDALNLACALRDEHPQLVWDTLSRLDRTVLQELAVIALAGIPIESKKSDVYGWVLELPAAKWSGQ